MDVVSVAEKSRLDVWKVAAPAIRQRIQAEAYKVIVPVADLEIFSALPGAPFVVESEAEYSSHFASYLEESISGENEDRYGWYLQQLIKLEALKRLAEESRRGLIWDADTVPLQEISFFDPKPGLFFGDEHHVPYFRAIDRLLTLDRKVDRSFIAQCFPCEPDWILSFCAAIERKHSEPWWKAVIDSIDFRERSGFSEYETLGTFVSHHFPTEWEWNPQEWSRDGYSIFGSPKKAHQSSQRVDTGLAFVAFEAWKSGGKKGPWRALTSTLSCLKQVFDKRSDT